MEQNTDDYLLLLLYMSKIIPLFGDLQQHCRYVQISLFKIEALQKLAVLVSMFWATRKCFDLLAAHVEFREMLVVSRIFMV